jgi:hypothetical protein
MPVAGFPVDPNTQAMMANQYFMQFYGQQQQQPGFGQFQQQGMGGYPGILDPGHQFYQFQGK